MKLRYGISVALGILALSAYQACATDRARQMPLAQPTRRVLTCGSTEPKAR